SVARAVARDAAVRRVRRTRPDALRMQMAENLAMAAELGDARRAACQTVEGQTGEAVDQEPGEEFAARRRMSEKVPARPASGARPGPTAAPLPALPEQGLQALPGPLASEALPLEALQREPWLVPEERQAQPAAQQERAEAWPASCEPRVLPLLSLPCQ